MVPKLRRPIPVRPYKSFTRINSGVITSNNEFDNKSINATPVKLSSLISLNRRTQDIDLAAIENELNMLKELNLYQLDRYYLLRPENPMVRDSVWGQ
jgi:hypothetical protein